MSQYQQYSSGNSGKQPEFSLRKYRPIIVTVLLLIVGIIFVSKSFIILEPTEKGIIFYKYGDGLDVENVYGEGLNVVAPWNEMIIFDVAEQKAEETLHGLSNNGLNIDLDVTIRYKPEDEKVGFLYKQFQEDYHARLVIPELRSAVRTVIGKYSPEEIYSTKRTQIEVEINELITRKLAENNVKLTAMLMRQITLPSKIKEAIETKLAEEQNAERYDFVLETSRKEAERKAIQARGEALANAILDSSLTENLLRMRGIEATMNLSESENAKIIVIGSGKDGLPIILGNQ